MLRTAALTLLLLLVQDANELARAKDKLLAAVTKDDTKAAKEAIEPLMKGDGRALLAAMQKVRDRQLQLDRDLDEDHKNEERIENDIAAGGDATTKVKSLDAVHDRQSTHHSQLLHLEEIDQALRRAIFEMGAAAMRALLDDLEKAGSWHARADAALLLGFIDAAEVAPALLARLEKEDRELVAAEILESLARRGGARSDAVKRVAPKLEAKAWQARRGAIRALAAGGAKEAVEPLVIAIAKADGLLRIELDAALRALTKTELGDPGLWPDWWKQNGEAFLAGTYKPPPPKAAGVGKTRFYGLEVKSTRVAFVIDRSGSMSESAEKGGPKRMDIVKGELKALLAVMSDSARVNVIFFGDKVDAMAVAPRPLDKKGRDDAAKFIESIFPAKRTNLYDAVSRALSFAATADGQGVLDGIDTIYLLSDGEPTFGAITWSNLAEMVIRRINRRARVTIHAIAVGDTCTLLKDIAAGSGGEYVQK